MSFDHRKQPIVTDGEIKWMRRALRAYYLKHGRNLPWRDETNPYLILNAEIILQRTKAEDTAKHWTGIKKHLSSAKACLRANRFLSKLFGKLGLSKRKKWMLNIARIVNAKEGVPKTLEELQQLPGVGWYTSRATLAFAYHKNNGLVDANVIRLFERFWGKFYHHDLRQKVKFWLPKSKNLGGRKVFRFVFWGLLDLCAQICTPRMPRCYECPIKKKCKFALANKNKQNKL
ncbi:MAG: hypothetical protein ACREOI_08125 [bacterium]